MVQATCNAIRFARITRDFLRYFSLSKVHIALPKEHRDDVEYGASVKAM
jgi:hypothetical protein